MKDELKIKLPGLRLRSKLIAVFALVSLIPTVSLVFVSHFIIAQSIDRWESVSSELVELLVLPIGDKAMEIASDPLIIQALEDGDLSKLSFTLPENYIVAIYNTTGEKLFSTNDEPALKERLNSLEEVGLPPVDEFWPGQPITPKEVKLKDKELALSATICQSMEDGENLGVIVFGKFVPSAPAGISSKSIAAILTSIAVLIFLIALWISSLIAKEITGPIRELVAGTQEVASGDLDYQVDVDARDEVGLLADSFNRMTVKLRHNAEELKRAEKAAAWQEIAQKLAHEIKNPLTPIQLSAERLKRRYHSKPEGYEEILDECTDTIIHEVGRLRMLLDEFSRLARMPRAKPVPSDINSIIEKAVRLYGEFPENVKVIPEYAESMPQISVDPEQMERVSFNIIKNAVEAMQDGGELTLSTRIVIEPKSKYIEMKFADTGPGISAESMDKLFTPHFSTKKGGTGLGLAIVQKIITDHSGDVTVQSEEGQGTVFTLRIPIVEGVDNG